MSKIRILVVEPYKAPYQIRVEHTLENLQKVVGGLIEFVELEHNVDLICNEEGKLLSLPLNRPIRNDIIAGTFFIAGQHYGETISLSRKQIKKYKTKGDNNNTEDAPLSVDRIIGKCVMQLSGLGKLTAALKSPFTMVMVLLIGIMICFLVSTDKNGNPVLTEEEIEFQKFREEKRAKEALEKKRKVK